MTSVFVSYNHRDLKQLAPLIKALRDAGLDVMDTTLTLPGATLAESVEERIRASDAVLVLLSENYLAGPWVFAELAQAIQARKRLIPVKLTPGVELPAILRPYQAVELTDPATRAAAVAALASFLTTTGPAWRMNYAEEISRVNQQIKLIEQEQKTHSAQVDPRRVHAANNAIVALTSAAGAGVGALVAGPVGAVLGASVGALIGRSARQGEQRSDDAEPESDSPDQPADRDGADA